MGTSGQQLPVHGGQVGAGDHCVGRDQLALVETHAGHRARLAEAADDSGHRRVPPEPGSPFLRRHLQPSGDGMDPPFREPHPAHGVHVGDHAVHGQGLERRQAGVQRLEAEQLLQAFVLEVRRHHRRRPPEGTEAQQAQRRGERPDQVERRVVVALDEVALLHGVETGQPVAEAAERRGVARAALLADFLAHRLPTSPHRDGLLAGKVGPVQGIEGRQAQMRAHVGAGGAEGVGQDARHGQHARPGVDAVARRLPAPGPPAGTPVALDHRDLVSPPDQVTRGRQAAQAGADDDDAPGGSWPAHAFVFSAFWAPGTTHTARRRQLVMLILPTPDEVVRRPRRPGRRPRSRRRRR